MTSGRRRRPRRPDATLRRRRLLIGLCVGAALAALIALDRSGRLLVPSGAEPLSERDASAAPAGD